MRVLFALLLILCGVALGWDGYSFVNRALVLDDVLGLPYTNLKFGAADRSSVETVGYGLCAIGLGLCLLGLKLALPRRG